VRVLAVWNQVPRALRQNFKAKWKEWQLTNPAYELRSLRMTVDLSSGNVTFPSDFEDFDSSTLLQRDARIGRSVQGPATAIFLPVKNGDTWDDTGSSRGFYQLGSEVFGANEGGSSFVLAGSGVVPRFRPPVAATHLQSVSLPFNQSSTLELVAWILPDASAGSKQQRIAFAFHLPHIARQSSRLRVREPSGEYVTLDPAAAIVAVGPWVGTDKDGWPLGRIVWKADGDVRWADVSYQDPFPNPPPAVTVRQVSSALGKPGPFPAHATEASVSRRVIMWTHDGTVMTVRLP
jgi:hypothetical protein